MRTSPMTWLRCSITSKSHARISSVTAWNGTRLAAKCSAFFISGSCHVGKFSKSVFELPRFDAVGTVADSVRCDCREQFGPEPVFVDDAQREIRCEAVHGL